MKRSKLYNALWLLFLLPLFSGCNNTDDVAALFIGKSWKLNYITFDGGHEMVDFWDNNAEARKKSIELLNQAGTYTFQFTGAVTEDVISGKISGKLITKNFEGTWSANGRNNNFKASVTGSDEDLLAKNFLIGMNSATSYEGDDKNLFILYTPKSSQRTYRMAFRKQ